MTPELDSLGLTAFLEVCITKNFTKAAERLHITQSALSQRIRRFEDNLGTSLIYRSTPNLSLTSAGLEVLSYGMKKKVLVDELQRRLHSVKVNAPSGIVRIGAFSSVLRSVIMPGLRNLIRETHQLRLEFFSKEVFSLPDMLLRGAIDIAILDHELIDNRISSIHLFDEHYVMIEPKDIVAPNIYLDHDPQDRTTYNFFNHQGLADLSFERSYCDEIYGVIDAVRLGMGKAIAPLHLVHNNDDIRIVHGYKTYRRPVIAHHLHEQTKARVYARIIDELKRGSAPNTRVIL